MIQVLILTGLMAIFQIEAVNVQAVHTDETIINVGVVLLEPDSTILNISKKVQVIRDFLEVPKVITEYNKIGFSAEVWIL